MDYIKSMRYLDKLELFGIKLGLKNIKRLLKLVGNPEKELNIVHIAGTNGKGSISAMISSILQSAGYNVGLCTSPHLWDFRERIRINNKDISKKELSGLLTELKPAIEKTNTTYFESVTALAFLHFKRKDVDFVVLEVGMGGRLDATNVADPLVSVITNIALEHTEYLGNTIKKIAYEKAGIIKRDSIVVTGADGKALEVIKGRCKTKNSRLVVVKNKYEGRLSLKGEFQKTNAAVAVAAVDALKNKNFRISKKDIRDGLKKAYWPGRLQFKGNMLMDCAHNPAGMEKLSEFVKSIKNGYKKVILVIGILKYKDYKAMIGLIAPLADKIIITKPNTGRALDPRIIAEEIKKLGKDSTIKPKVKEAIRYARSIAKKEELILAAGSCYLIGEIK